MQDEYINKIIEIGKKGVCTPEDFKYFTNKLPTLGNRELSRILRIKYKINAGHITRREFLALNRVVSEQQLLGSKKEEASFLVDFIKGCHLIEIKYGGFGSTTNVYNVIGSLAEIDVNKAVDLYDWIAFNGGNYYIKSGISFEDSKIMEENAKKQRAQILLDDQKKHSDAVAKKQNKKDLHVKISNEKQLLYREYQEKFQKMDNEQLIDTYKEDVKKSGWVSARGYFYAALNEELKKRGLNPKSLSY